MFQAMKNGIKVVITTHDEEILYVNGETESHRVYFLDESGAVLYTGRGFDCRDKAEAFADGARVAIRALEMLEKS